jgi:hypothetical protein
VYTAPRKSFLNKGYSQDSCESIGSGDNRLHGAFCTGVIVCYTPSLAAQTALLGLDRQYFRHLQKTEGELNGMDLAQTGDLVEHLGS